MRKGALTERQALDMVGPGIVRKLQSMQVEPTSRLYDHDDGEIEWSASLTTETIPDGVPCVATAYYYTSPADSALVESVGGDWGAVEWAVEGYEIE